MSSFFSVLETILDKAVASGAVEILQKYLNLSDDSSVTEVALLCLNAIQDTSKTFSFPHWLCCIKSLAIILSRAASGRTAMKDAGVALTVAHLLRSDAIEEFYDVIFDVLNNLAEDGAYSNVAVAGV